MVAGRCADTPLCITIDGKTGNIDHATSNAFVGLSFTAYAKCQRVAGKLGGVEAANAVAESDGCQIDKVHERVYLVEFLALQHPSDECLAGRTVAGGVLAASPIDVAGGGNGGHLLERLGGELLPVALFQGVYLVPQGLTVGGVDNFCFNGSSCKGGAYVLDFWGYSYLYHSYVVQKLLQRYK